jgi:predicted Holliday junction resolvase-like endonuclease
MLIGTIAYYHKKVKKIGESLKEIEKRGRSLSSTYGRITEQFAPFISSYPYDPQDFRFIGSPIDGVQFNDDGIIFIEVKSSRSRLSEREKKVKELVERGMVSWMEFRIG